MEVKAPAGVAELCVAGIARDGLCEVEAEIGALLCAREKTRTSIAVS